MLSKILVSFPRINLCLLATDEDIVYLLLCKSQKIMELKMKINFPLMDVLCDDINLRIAILDLVWILEEEIWVKSLIIIFLSQCTEMMFGVKIVVTGDKPPKSENSVIIMNHRCRLDWMFFWSFVARYGELKHEKIIMKRELKHIPGPGKYFHHFAINFGFKINFFFFF